MRPPVRCWPICASRSSMTPATRHAASRPYKRRRRRRKRRRKEESRRKKEEEEEGGRRWGKREKKMRKAKEKLKFIEQKRRVYRVFNFFSFFLFFLSFFSFSPAAAGSVIWCKRSAMTSTTGLTGPRRCHGCTTRRGSAACAPSR